MGTPLTIPLPVSRKVGDEVRVQIFYSTTKECPALQWLDKEFVLAPQSSLPSIFSPLPDRPKERHFPSPSAKPNPSTLAVLLRFRTPHLSRSYVLYSVSPSSFIHPPRFQHLLRPTPRKSRLSYPLCSPPSAFPLLPMVPLTTARRLARIG